MLDVSREDDREGSVPAGKSLSIPLSSDIMEKRVMSDGIGSQGDSPSSKSSCSWPRENCSDMQLDRIHLASSRPVSILNIIFQTHGTNVSPVNQHRITLSSFRNCSLCAYSLTDGWHVSPPPNCASSQTFSTLKIFSTLNNDV